MTTLSSHFALRARLVFPIAAPPIEGGVVTIRDGRIVAVARQPSDAVPIDLGDIAILPGLVNAHTHLEFSELKQPFGAAGTSLPNWIDEVVTARRAAAERPGEPLSSDRRRVAIDRGIRECLQGGATSIGDIANWDVGESLRTCDAAHYFEFREFIGLSDSRVTELVAAATELAGRLGTPITSHAQGVSPHAPYTASLDLVQQLVALSRRFKWNTAMHLAESPEELQLLASSDGPFRELLQKFDVWHAPAFPGNRYAIDYLRVLAAAHRSLVIHGNYLGSQDWEFLAQQQEAMSVVYCPRTHAYFQHPPYPLCQMLRAGVRVILGTDGRSSNPDLSLFEELKFATRNHPDVSPSDLLRAVTLDAATALGLRRDSGSLEPGKRADLAVVQFEEAALVDPYETLLSDRATIKSVWVGGVRRDLERFRDYCSDVQP